MKKDVLFLCQYFYPEYVSSATLPFDTAEALAKDGYSVGVICGYPKEYNRSNELSTVETYKNIYIKRLKYLQLKRSNFLGRLINYFSFTFSVALHFRELRNYKSIIVYSNPPILPFIAAMGRKFLNTKVVFVSYDVYPEIAIKTNMTSEKSLISKLMNRLNKTVFNSVDKVVALSSEMKTYLLNNRSGITESQIEIIPNWFEDKGRLNGKESLKTELFHPLKEKDNFIVSYFGNMGIAQDLDTLFSAMCQLKSEDNVKFVFAGHGTKLESLKQIVIKENLDNVTVFDFLHGQEFEDALKISDCFVVSLAEDLTGLAVPSKTYSYMMAGKPIIAIMGTDSDIAKDLRKGNAGYAMGVGDTTKLVNSICQLRDNKLKRIEMGENCRNIFLNKYTKEICTRKYIELIDEIIGG